MAHLFDYQIDALKKMKNGCILCGGVGSGKSITALAYYYLQNDGDISCLENPCMEYIPMGDPPKDLYIITTAKKRDTLEWEEELAGFLLSTDGKLNLYTNKVIVDSWNNIKKYKDICNAFFIFDEQRVVGSGEWVKSFLKIARGNEWILLSATPGDTWMDYIPVFLANGFYRNRTEFKDTHVVMEPYSKFPKVRGYINQGRLLKYRKDILVTMDFKRETVAHDIVIDVEYDKIAYKSAIKTRWNPWTNKPMKNSSEFCQVLRKIINTDDSRQTKVLEIVEETPRVIIFYNYDYELEILRNLCYGDDVTVAEWNGHKHEKVPDTDKWVYLVQYSAGAEGWNCISTNTMIFFSQNYSYKILSQAKGRIDRLNTTFKDLYYYHFKSKAGIDYAISKALSEKKQFNERSFAGGV